jgi:SAM-dependent methyltransferase
MQNDSFDAVVIVLVLHQLTAKERKMAFGEVFRVLRPGAYFVVKTTAPSDLARRSFVGYFPSGLKLHLMRYPSMEELELIGSESGLDLVERNDTHKSEDLDVAEVSQAISGKHNTTMALLPSDEFDLGLERLRRDRS